MVTEDAAITTTLYLMGNFVNDTLQYIAHEEGRIRFNREDSSLQYDYFIRDHLGNVRLVLTEQQQTDAYPVASLETASLTNEQLYYSGLDTGRVNKSGIAGYHSFTTHTQSGLTLTKSGFLYVYVSNETPNIDVFFDNLQVTHIRGPLIEENHYYSFGLTMAGISSKAVAFGSPNNKFKYNGYEENTDFDLNLYETFYRLHDPQLGRFWQIDPKIEVAEAWSPYSAMLNNPILYNDPLGDIVRNAHDEEVRVATERRDAARADLDASMAANGVDENVSKKDFLKADHSKAEWKAFKNTRNAFNRAESRLNTALSNQFEAQEDINELVHNNPTLFNAVNNLPIDVFIGRTDDPNVRVDAGGGANVYGMDGAGNIRGRMYNLDDLFGGVAQFRAGMAVWIQRGRGQYTTVMHEVGHTVSMYGGVPAIGIGGIPYGAPDNPANLNDYVRNFAPAWGGGCQDCRTGRGCNPTSAAAVAAENLPLETAARYVRAANPFRRR